MSVKGAPVNRKGPCNIPSEKIKMGDFPIASYMIKQLHDQWLHLDFPLQILLSKQLFNTIQATLLENNRTHFNTWGVKACSMVLKYPKMLLKRGQKGRLFDSCVDITMRSTSKNKSYVTVSAAYGTPHLTPSCAKPFSRFMLVNCFENGEVFVCWGVFRKMSSQDHNRHMRGC